MSDTAAQLIALNVILLIKASRLYDGWDDFVTTVQLAKQKPPCSCCCRPSHFTYVTQIIILISSLPISIMPPRPLPIQLRVGTDICQITRIRKAVFREVPTEKEKEQRTYTRPVNLSHKARLELFMNKLFNHRERTRFWLHFPKFNVDDERGARRRRVVEYLSGRYVFMARDGLSQ